MKDNISEDPPPFLGTWRRVYTAVLFYLAALIVALWFFGKAWS